MDKVLNTLINFSRGYCVFSFTYGQVPGLPLVAGLDKLENGAQQLSEFVDKGNYDESSNEPFICVNPICLFSIPDAASFFLTLSLVLAATGVKKLDLVGHSAGTLMPRYYLRFLGGASKVRTSQQLFLNPQPLHTAGTVSTDHLVCICDLDRKICRLWRSCARNLLAQFSTIIER